MADFGLAEDVYTTQYFKLDKSTTEPALLPIKWTALEGIHDGLFTEKSDVVSDYHKNNNQQILCILLHNL